MVELDTLLTEAGARWRASQPPPPAIDEAALVRRTDRLHFAWPVAGAAALVVTALVAVGIWTSIAPGERGAPGTGGLVDGECVVTRPDAPLRPPEPYPPVAPQPGRAWFGTPELWTMLDRDGEVWSMSVVDIGEKLFWWSRQSDPAGPIGRGLTVTGTRLDGPETFTAGPATNAQAPDLGGGAMLVGVQFPSPGCWQLTGRYRGAELSYVVLVEGD